jgi:hypothetical protein
LEEILGFISDYGVTVVISGIFLYGALQLINIGLGVLRGKAGSAAAPVVFEKKAEIDLKVQLLINKLLADSGGERVTVMEMHNHAENLASVPFFYMSCSYEAFKPGMTPVSGVLRQISASLYSQFFSDLQREPYLVVDTSSPSASRTAYELVLAQGSTKSLCAAMRDAHGRAIGYVALKKEGDITDFDITSTKAAAGQIEALLGVFAPKPVAEGGLLGKWLGR